MVKRTVLSPTPKRLVEERLGTLADAIKGHNTTPTGNKDLGVNGNIIWTRPDGSSITVRHVDEELVDARERIDDATADLADTQERLDGAEQVITTVGSELDNLANATIPSIVADLEAADQAAAQELATLDGKLNTLDGVVEGKPDFDDLTVGNLLAGSVATPEAVIDKIWADGIAAKSLTANRVVVSSGNIAENTDFSVSTGLGSYWSSSPGMNGGHSVLVPASTGQQGTYDTISGVTSRTRVVAGRSYKYGVWVRTSATFSGTNGVAMYLTFYDDGGSRVIGAKMVASLNSATSDEWTFMEGPYLTPEGATNVALGYFTNSTYQGSARFSEPSVIPMTGAVLIEDGAITTPKLTVTGDMSAAIVNAMSVNTKKLVVTEEAILNHATLIGQTVVDDINVQGKLIGTDGVFTGTVDFANVNVTGDVLASKISGEHIYGTIVEGGEIRTTAESGGQVILSDNGFVSSYSGAVAPGLMLIPADTSQMANPPGIGPFEGGVAVDGGRSADGGYSFLRTKPEGTLLYARDANNSRGEIQTLPGISLMTSSQGSSESRLQARPTEMFIRNTAGDGTQGETLVRSDRATLTTRDPAGATMSTIGAQGRGAWMRAYAVNGDTASGNMSQDQANLWVRTATGATKSILCADNRAAYMRANATDGTHGIASATPALAHLSTYGSDGATHSTLRADGRTVWMRANATNGDSGFVQASPTYSLIKSESGTGNREVATDTEKAYLKATATSGNYSMIESAHDGARMTRVDASSNVRTCAFEVYGGEARMWGTDGQHMYGRVFANSEGVQIYSGYGDAYIRLRRDGDGDQFACNAIYSRTSSAAANVSVTSYGTVRRMTSSRRYKRNIANWSPDPKAVLALQPRQWQDRQDVAEIDETWHVGFIAEEVDDLGLKKLVQYVGDGKGGWIPESLNYDRFAAAQQVVLQKHEAEIKELRERIALLESK